MSDEQALAEARSLRSDAWALVRGDVSRLRGGLEQRTIAQRLKDRATDEVMEAVDGAVAVASDNKAVVGVTVAALAGWLFRGPLWKLVQPLLPNWLKPQGD